MNARSLFALLCLTCVGCGYHRVSLPPMPEKSAPVKERMAAYKDLLPESGLETTYFRNGMPVGSSINYLMLGNGVRVEDPRDLLPAMEPKTPAVNYVESFDEKVGRAKTFGYIGIGGIVLGTGVMLSAPLSLALGSQHTGPSSGAPSSLFVGLGVGGGIMLLSLIPVFIGALAGGEAAEDRLSAFQTYPKSLQKRLALDEDAAPVPAPTGAPLPPSVSRPSDAPYQLLSSP